MPPLDLLECIPGQPMLSHRDKLRKLTKLIYVDRAKYYLPYPLGPPAPEGGYFTQL